jgi:hypothetical protein
MSALEPVDPGLSPPIAARVTQQPAAPLPGAAPAPVVRVLRVALSRAIPMAVYQFNRVGRAGVIGAGLLMSAAIFLFAAVLPQYRVVTALRDEITTAQRRGPAEVSPHLRLNRFVEGLPKRSELPGIAGQMFKLAAAAGVTLDRGRYELTPLHAGHLARYRMSFPVKGAYPGIRQFIDSTLIAIPSAAVDGLRIERKGVGDPTVEADLRFSVFVRNES